MKTNISRPAVGPVPVRELVAEHIGAIANHERLFQLNDWGLVEQDEVRMALGPVDEILIEICAARPSEASEIELRRAYLRNVLPDAIYDNKALTEEVVVAFIGRAGRS
ncbi:hypothetical protein [Agrobacterium tumefaciens]|uniref:hypothetical protein n=1 Tax=Agrobacterium tumefaciens TaxID=358 RepID=UPI00045B0A9B|nr:hypothetical protein [Agrobacterium tumefaciens]CDN92509.1 hypothetical protein BN949_01654 [Agrobacterium tumefaciens]